MRVHLDVLGWLHVMVGWMGLLTGAALLTLAAGTAALSAPPSAQAWSNPVVWLLLLGGVLLATGGAVAIAVGRGLVARRPSARPMALLLALVHLCALPFGTALGVYTFWALLNDDARREFGRRLRAPSVS
jgi:hypothetical protein